MTPNNNPDWPPIEELSDAELLEMTRELDRFCKTLKCNVKRVIEFAKRLGLQPKVVPQSKDTSKNTGA